MKRIGIRLKQLILYCINLNLSDQQAVNSRSKVISLRHDNKLI